MLDLILSSQNELVDSVKICEPLGSSDHNQIHFNIKVKQRINIKNNGVGYHKNQYQALLFLIYTGIYIYIYINDLEDDKVLKFADYTKVVRKVTNDTDKQSLQDDLD